mmetsp:Transcript_10534/g.23937  ORF Transcript_10534/g.23937 Transcript_10534/m.23937 type:complete len:350 (-) Transcript_10534:63-1112(-)
MLAPNQLPYVLAGMGLMTLQPLLVAMSQVNGKVEYSAVSSTLATETLKIVISTAMLFGGGHEKPTFDMQKCVEFSVPALIYFINNNLVFLILDNVNPTTFQLLSQLKTVFTGLLFRLFLGKVLTPYQYIAIWQLSAGTACSQIPLDQVHPSPEVSTNMGLILSVVSCILSAFGGIYSEKLLKKGNAAAESIHWQNIQLYGWGILFNFLGTYVEPLFHPTKSTSSGDGSSMFAGYNTWAYMVVINNALNGLAISAILKYADNIARVYAHAAAMLLTMTLSIFLFGQDPTPQLIIAIAVVAASAVQYNLKLEDVYNSAVLDRKSPLPSSIGRADEEMRSLPGEGEANRAVR